MKRLLAALAVTAAMLPGCAPMQDRTVAVSFPAAWLHPGAAMPNCHATAGGRPEWLAERGIGGTGPIEKPRPSSPDLPGPPQPTGVGAIITGFGSVCLAGLEVGLAPNLAVTVDGVPALQAALRAGQRAALIAHWADGRPRTASVAIWHEVVGPIEAVGAQGGLRVAGQRVQLAVGAWVEGSLAPGTWVAVSGLHAPDGAVLATRIDPAPAGPVVVRGRLEGTPGALRVGDLPVDLAGLSLPPSRFVVLQGRIKAGTLRAQSIREDLFEADPAAYFGPDVRRYALQALVQAKGQSLRGFALSLSVGPGVAMPAGVEPAIIGLDRQGLAGVAVGSISPLGLSAPASSPPGVASAGMAPAGMAPAGLAPPGMAPLGMAPADAPPAGPLGVGGSGIGAAPGGRSRAGMCGAAGRHGGGHRHG